MVLIFVRFIAINRLFPGQFGTLISIRPSDRSQELKPAWKANMASDLEDALHCTHLKHSSNSHFFPFSFRTDCCCRSRAQVIYLAVFRRHGEDFKC